MSIGVSALYVEWCASLAIDAYYGCMADFSHILMTRPDFGDDDREWLHQLVADWQVIADLSFADLLLILQNGEGKYIIAEQCRPSTVMSLRAEDVVGNVVPESLCAELDAAMDFRIGVPLLETAYGRQGQGLQRVRPGAS